MAPAFGAETKLRSNTLPDTFDENLKVDFCKFVDAYRAYDFNRPQMHSFAQDWVLKALATFSGSKAQYREIYFRILLIVTVPTVSTLTTH